MRHTISILLQNEAGALTRVAGLFSSRGYNIESLHVAPTQDESVSRLTLVTSGPDTVINQICSQLLKLVDVVNLVDMTHSGHIERELILLKMTVTDAPSKAMLELIKEMGARTLDDRHSSYTIELAASSPTIEQFVNGLSAFGKILTVVRSGTLAVSRGEPVHG